ncbi:MAG: hypothetical protein JXA54_08185 [Candidatus Heimdallarchaeota archaeon]|nr:hypothetical protein [Candidatus Heimdallarchaeota archaeon]
MKKFTIALFYLLFLLMAVAYATFAIWGLVVWGSADPFINERITIILLSLPVLSVTILLILTLIFAPFFKLRRRKRSSNLIGNIIQKVMFGQMQKQSHDFSFDFPEERD